MHLARINSFFAGARKVEIAGAEPRVIQLPDAPPVTSDPNGTYAIEGCYVQELIHADPIGLPVWLIHGGAMTGAAWEATPDGRPGFVQLLLQARRSVLVADMVERGRAGWCALPKHWPSPPIMRTAQEVWWLFRLGAMADFATRIPFPGQRFPIAAFDTLLPQFVPRWLDGDARADAGFLAALGRIGRCVVLAHSSGAPFAFRLAAARPDLVAAVVALEPFGFAPHWPAAAADVPVLALYGDFIAQVPVWQQMQAACAALGPSVTLRQRAGHSHLMMMDHGHDDLLAEILAWLAEQDV